MKIQGKVTSVNLHETGGSANIGGAAAPGMSGSSANINFPKEDASAWAALIGKTVVVEVNEVVA